MYWTLELASYLSDAPWPATKDELIDYAIRTGAPLEVVENLQAIEEEEEETEEIKGGHGRGRRLGRLRPGRVRASIRAPLPHPDHPAPALRLPSGHAARRRGAEPPGRPGARPLLRVRLATNPALASNAAATSVDDIQEAADISRGTFFYHFPSKDDLAKALIHRYAEADHALVEGFKERAEKLASDPLQQALIFLALHEDLLEEVSPEEAGCLFASLSYEAGVLDSGTHSLIVESIEHWRRVLGGKLEEAMRRHTPIVSEIDPHLLADVAYGVLQGAFILRRSLDDPGLMARHVREFRRYLEVLFGVVSDDAPSDDERSAAVARSTQ